MYILFVSLIEESLKNIRKMHLGEGCKMVKS